MNIKKLLDKYRIKPDLSKDQSFLIDEGVINNIVDIAHITKEDRVLEVGAGLGFLTRELASRAKSVIAIEIDKQFEPFLEELPENVEIIYGDAYRLLNSESFRSEVSPPTKTVSNVPYSQAQNMLHNYTNSSWYQGDLVWLAPTSLANKVNNEPILGAYFTAEVAETIPKSAFYPRPNTSSAIVYFKRIPDPVKSKNLEIYFRRWLYNHEGWKVKNALREGIIKAVYDLRGIRITKNEARNFMSELGVSGNEMEILVNNIRPEYYFYIPKKLGSWFEQLETKK